MDIPDSRTIASETGERRAVLKNVMKPGHRPDLSPAGYCGASCVWSPCGDLCVSLDGVVSQSVQICWL